MSSPTEGPNAAGAQPAGWYSDPLGRFDLRYHNGRSWTADVSLSGERFVDPTGTAPTRTSPSLETGSPRATAAMVLGIVAIGIGWFPYVAVAGLVCALLAIGLGISARRRSDSPASTTASRARVGITPGIVGLIVAVLGLVFTVIIARALDRYANPEPNDAVVTSCEVDDGVVAAAGELTNRGNADADFTVRVAITRAGTDNVHRTATVEVDDVEPGASVPFALTVEVALDEVSCAVHDVDGPLPFGVDIPT
ncbi:MAG: DUF2510 domain-containing protein [Acidimicrobiia bacterium]|nr:DUF2510 domain-containing protein [Acidimicrobiia bacterium]